MKETRKEERCDDYAALHLSMTISLVPDVEQLWSIDLNFKDEMPMNTATFRLVKTDSMRR